MYYRSWRTVHRTANSCYGHLHARYHTRWSACIGTRSKLTTSTRSRPYSTADKGATIDCRIEELQPGKNIATVTVSNPRKLNIVTTPLLVQIVENCKELAKTSSIRAVVLTGGKPAPGKAPAFIGGADINEMHRLSGPDEARQFITRIHLACKAIRDLHVPVIARVHGYSLGAGLEIMAACDLRIASESSSFGMPEVRVGIPSVVEAALLPGLIGMARTRRMLYLAENFGALQAESWGLVDRIVPDEPSLDSAVREWTGKICEAGPLAMREQKGLIQKWEECSASEGIAAGIDSFSNAYADGGYEPKAYMGHFLKKDKSEP